MSELIPPFNWQSVVMEPWSSDPDVMGWTVLMGFLVTMTCGLIGNYLIWRRMALVGDAISHSVLLGLVLAFLAAGAVFGVTGEAGGAPDYRNPLIMFAGALLAGVLTTVLIELIHKKSRVKQDAAIGITFSSLFAIGVILISVYASQVDLDQDCVLYGEISYVPLEPLVVVAGHEIAPPSVIRMAAVALMTLLLIALFYKELLVSSFDPGLAASLGINATVVHYGLMCWLSVVVVSAFESVGAILVIAMLIMPGATASLLSDRFPRIMGLTVVHAALSSVGGQHLAIWLQCTEAGAMVVVGGLLFGMAWLYVVAQRACMRRRQGHPATAAAR